MTTQKPAAVHRVKLLRDLPIEARHGATKGRIFNAIRSAGPERRRLTLFYFVGDAGKVCAAYGSECEDV